MTMRAPGAPPAAGEVIGAAVAATRSIVQGTGPDESKLLVDHAKAVGEFLKNQGLTTSQIRNVFGTVRSIESTWRLAGTAQPQQARLKALRELNLLKPRLAYAASRSPVVRYLAEVLNPAIDAVLADTAPAAAGTGDLAAERFSHFLDFFEAILAYHRAAGGR